MAGFHGDIPSRIWKGTGDTDVDITFLGLSAHMTDSDLRQKLKAEFLEDEDGNGRIDWQNCTATTIKVKATAGQDWELRISGRDDILAEM